MAKNIESAAMAALSAQDRKDLTAWRRSATTVRNRSGELLVRFAGYLKDGNVAGLNALTQTVCEVRGFNVDALVRFILFHTGGGNMQGENIVFMPERSVLRYNVKEVSWSINKVDLTKEEREKCADKEAEKAARAEKVEAQQNILKSAAQRMGKGEWWLFAPEKPANPYNFKSLVSALKKAKENADNLPAEQAKAVAELLAVAEAHHLFD